MSKINIGVGDDFPLDESPAGEDHHACKHGHHRHAMRCGGRGWHGRQSHHGHGHPHQDRHEQHGEAK